MTKVLICILTVIASVVHRLCTYILSITDAPVNSKTPTYNSSSPHTQCPYHKRQIIGSIYVTICEQSNLGKFPKY